MGTPFRWRGVSPPRDVMQSTVDGDTPIVGDFSWAGSVCRGIVWFPAGGLRMRRGCPSGVKPGLAVLLWTHFFDSGSQNIV